MIITMLFIDFPRGKPGEESARLVRDMGDAHFRGPLQQQQLAALRRTCGAAVDHGEIEMGTDITICI